MVLSSDVAMRWAGRTLTSSPLTTLRSQVLGGATGLHAHSTDSADVSPTKEPESQSLFPQSPTIGQSRRLPSRACNTWRSVDP